MSAAGMLRDLAPGGRIQIGDILVHKEVPQDAKESQAAVSECRRELRAELRVVGEEQDDRVADPRRRGRGGHRARQLVTEIHRQLREPRGVLPRGRRSEGGLDLTREG